MKNVPSKIKRPNTVEKKTFERRIVYDAKITLIILRQQQVKMTNKVLL